MTNAPQAKRSALLKAGEKLFAVDGYHGISLRDVAREANVKLSLLMYHFETKENFYYTIFAERQFINDERVRRLGMIEDFTAVGALEEIVDAFIGPVLALHDQADSIWFARLVLREASDPSSQDRKVISELFDPLARTFIDALRQALPDKQAGFHEWAYLFSVGALTQSSFDTRMENLIGEGASPRDVDKAKFLRSYLVAAFAHAGEV